MENDPAQMREVVYELARLKLQKEAWQRHPPITVKDTRRLMLALEVAVDRVETISSRRNELRARAVNLNMAAAVNNVSNLATRLYLRFIYPTQSFN
jgi:hypothetical protein